MFNEFDEQGRRSDQKACHFRLWHKWTSSLSCGMSALRPRTEIASQIGHVRKAPR
jgi:hypothetical protein